MNIKELTALAKAQKKDDDMVKNFADRIAEREIKFENDRRQQAATEEFLVRSYTL